MLLEVLLDPFVLFCLGCIASPMLIDSAITRTDVVAYFSNPAIVGSFVALGLIVVVTKSGNCVKLSRADRMLARWYLLNGVIVHSLLDAGIGVFKVDPYLAKHYALVDRRYAASLGDSNAAAVHVVTILELVLKGPVCVALYYCMHRGSPHRDALELFTCVTQVYGTFVYLGQELLTRGRDLDVDWKLEFTFHHIFYFWFAVIFGCVLYLIIPAIVGWRTYKRLVHSCAIAAAAGKVKRG